MKTRDFPKQLARTLIVLVAASGVALATLSNDVRERVVNSAVLLKLNYNMETDSYAKRFHMQVAKTPTASVRCSGTFIKHGDKAYILTAAHCTEGSKKTRTETVDGKDRKVVYYDDAEFVTQIVKNGRKVGEISGIAKVLAAGDIEENGGDDLAILEPYDPDMARGAAEFATKGALKDYDIGSDIYNCGSLYGEFQGSLLKGIVSSRGFLYENKAFDTTDLSIRPGSSGSSVQAIANGKPYIVGVITRGDNKGAFGMYVGPERLHEWLVKNKLGFLVGEK